jgi:hypothetical protein
MQAPPGAAQAAGFGAPAGGMQAPAPGGGFGGAVGGFGAAAGGAMQQGFGGAMAGPGSRPTIRNPVVTLLMCFIPIYGLIVWYGMVKELKNFTNDSDFFEFGWIIPCYGLFWALSVLPNQVSKGKQMAGSQRPANSIVLYIFLAPYALASDLNQIADPNWTG